VSRLLYRPIPPHPFRMCLVSVSPRDCFTGCSSYLPSRSSGSQVEVHFTGCSSPQLVRRSSKSRTLVVTRGVSCLPQADVLAGCFFAASRSDAARARAGATRRARETEARGFRLNLIVRACGRATSGPRLKAPRSKPPSLVYIYLYKYIYIYICIYIYRDP